MNRRNQYQDIRFLLSVFFVGCIFWEACEKKEVPVIKVPNYLSRSFKDTLFYDLNPTSQSIILRMRLRLNLEDLENKKVLDSFYQARNYEPYFTKQFLENHGIDTLLFYLKNSSDHGLNTKSYLGDRIVKILERFQHHRTRNLVKAYIALADLELNTVNSLILYSKDLEFGKLNPKEIYLSQFNIKFKLPDSSLYGGVLNCQNIGKFLDSIQPKSIKYLTLKNKLHQLILESPENWSGQNPFNDSIVKLRVNLERYRWKPIDSSQEYLMVNIPEFKLYAYQKDSVVWTMKVCVGQRKKENFEERMSLYKETHNIDDKPENHQTPVLFSIVQSIQVNPKWSVPQSIIQNEIFYKMIQNPFYLQQNRMKLYEGNKEVAKPDTIHWNSLKRGKLAYTIKQDAGDFNSLGKLKFNFQNPFSVYLHDTPTKKAFNLKVRDVSHGCVRVEDPLKLAAYLLVGNGKYAMDLVRIKIGLKPGDDSSEHLQKLYSKEQEALNKNQHTFHSSSVPLKQKMPIYIQYYTAGVDENKNIFICQDIYRLDSLILNKL